MFGFNMRRLKVLFKALAVGPEFGESSQTFIEGGFSNIVGNAAIEFIGRTDEGFKMRSYLCDIFMGESDDAEYCDLSVHCIFLLLNGWFGYRRG